MVKVKLYFNDSGYINGWGTDWEDNNCYEFTQAQLDSIVLERSRVVDGEIITDGPELPEPEPPADELEQLQQENAALRERLGMTESAVLELARMIIK